MVGIAAYLYTIFIARFVRPTLKYEVTAIDRLSDTTAEVALRPRKKRTLDFRSGQFVFVHLVASAREGRLTAEDIAAASRGRLRDKDVYLCGPVPMITSLQRGLRRVGVRTSAIHFEEFSFR